MQWENSEIIIKKCWIDTNNNDIWVHIYHDQATNY